LFVGAVSTAISMLLGGSIGILSGYVGGRFDQGVMAVMDVLLSFPQLIMGLIIVALLGANLTDLILAIAITAVPPFARVARGPTLSLKERDFVEAGRALGFSNLRIMLVHILPNVLDDLIVMGSLWLATAIRTEASLSFIGLGLPPPTATWGSIIREGFENLLDAPWLAVFPSLAVLIVMLALNMIGDGLRDATDPKAAVS
jgi:peptide/nickel transport system permease protein